MPWDVDEPLEKTDFHCQAIVNRDEALTQEYVPIIICHKEAKPRSIGIDKFFAVIYLCDECANKMAEEAFSLEMKLLTVEGSNGIPDH